MSIWAIVILVMVLSYIIQMVLDSSINQYSKVGINLTGAQVAQLEKKLADYVSFKTKESDAQDGGNALFAALEYWNGGFVYNDKKNGVAMLKRFQQKRHGVTLDAE